MVNLRQHLHDIRDTPAFYIAVILFGISVVQFVILSLYSLVKHFERVKQWRETHQKHKNELELKTKDSSAPIVPLDEKSKHAKPEIIPLGWDWVIPPVTGAVMIIIWFVVLAVVDVPSDEVPYELLFNIALQILLMMFIVWIVFRVTDVLVPSQHWGLKDLYHELMKINRKSGPHKHQGKTGKNLIPILMKYVRIAVIICFALVIAQNLGFPIASVLGGLGIVGIAVAFAASTVIQNLFGACVVVIEELFHIGDWISINDVEGSVEKIGFRTTKIRQWDNRVTYVPNSIFVTTPLHNFQESKPMRIRFPLHLAIDTPIDNLETFLKLARQFIANEKDISKGRAVVTSVTQTGYVLDICVYTTEFNPKDDVNQDWAWYMPFLLLQEKVVISMMKIAKEAKVEIAIPPHRIMLEGDNHLPVHTKKDL